MTSHGDYGGYNRLVSPGADRGPQPEFRSVTVDSAEIYEGSVTKAGLRSVALCAFSSVHRAEEMRVDDYDPDRFLGGVRPGAPKPLSLDELIARAEVDPASLSPDQIQQLALAARAVRPASPTA